MSLTCFIAQQITLLLAEAGCSLASKVEGTDEPKGLGESRGAHIQSHESAAGMSLKLGKETAHTISRPDSAALLCWVGNCR